MRRSRPDVHMADVLRLEVPVKLGLEFGAVVGLHDQDSERQASEDIVDEADGRGLVAGIEDFEHADTRAIVDGRELVEAFPAAWNPLQKLHVDLQPMSWLRLLVPLPSLPPRPVFLIRR